MEDEAWTTDRFLQETAATSRETWRLIHQLLITQQSMGLWRDKEEDHHQKTGSKTNTQQLEEFMELARNGMSEGPTPLMPDLSLSPSEPTRESVLDFEPGESSSIEPFENPNKSDSPVQLNQDSTVIDEAIEDRTLLIKIHQLNYSITWDVLDQVFARFGGIEYLEIFSSGDDYHPEIHDYHSKIRFQYKDSAVRAYDTLNHRNIYDDGCRLELFLVSSTGSSPSSSSNRREKGISENMEILDEAEQLGTSVGSIEDESQDCQEAIKTPIDVVNREIEKDATDLLDQSSKLLIMVSPLSNSSGSMGCPEEYSWARDPRFDPAEEEIRQGLDDAAMDDPPDCPHVANMQDIARRLRDRVAGLEADIAHQHHNTSNVEATNEGLFHRLSSFSDDNRQLKKDLAEARALAAGSAADAAEYKGGLFIVGWLLIMAVAHILFVKTDF